ncbi:TPA: hypothetical protein MND73_004307 [Salmonella enterica subsp. houtenae]|nr:hypothetical protein [Salmonella enterica subsp. houtenae]
MSGEFNDSVKVDGAGASLQERQIYEIQRIVQSLINFVVTSLEELGIEKFHELTNPSLDELFDLTMELDSKAKELGNIELQQVLLTTQILIKDIKQKNPDLCAQSSRILKSALIFK